MKDIVKGFEGATYCDDSKYWIVPKKHYYEILEAVGQICSDKGVTLESIPEFVGKFPLNSKPWALSNCFYKKIGYQLDFYKDEPDPRKRDLNKLPSQLLQNIYDFQRQGI